MRILNRYVFQPNEFGWTMGSNILICHTWQRLQLFQNSFSILMCHAWLRLQFVLALPVLLCVCDMSHSYVTCEICTWWTCLAHASANIVSIFPCVTHGNRSLRFFLSFFLSFSIRMCDRWLRLTLLLVPSSCVCVTRLVWHDSCVCVTRLVWHDSCVCVTRLIRMCHVTHACGQHASFMRHASFICVTHTCDTWLIRVTHDSYVWHMTTSWARSHSCRTPVCVCVTWLLCVRVWHDSCICALDLDPKAGDLQHLVHF